MIPVVSIPAESGKENLGHHMTETGPIPQHWRVVRLREAADFRRREDKPNPSWVKQIPFMSVSPVPEGSLYIITWELRSPKEIRGGVPIYEGDLLVAKITSCLKNGKQRIVSNIPNGRGLATTEVIPIWQPSHLQSQFLAF